MCSSRTGILVNVKECSLLTPLSNCCLLLAVISKKFRSCIIFFFFLLQRISHFIGITWKRQPALLLFILMGELQAFKINIIFFSVFHVVTDIPLFPGRASGWSSSGLLVRGGKNHTLNTSPSDPYLMMTQEYQESRFTMERSYLFLVKGSIFYCSLRVTHKPCLSRQSRVGGWIIHLAL